MILDLMSFAIISLTQFNLIFSIPLIISSSVYLGSKVLLFKDFLSMIDALVAIYLILMIFGIQITLIYYMILGWFLYKLLFTLLS